MMTSSQTLSAGRLTATEMKTIYLLTKTQIAMIVAIQNPKETKTQGILALNMN